MSIGRVRLLSLLGTLTLVVVGCSSDSTTSEEYLDLEREFGVVEQELAEVTAERDVLDSEAADCPPTGQSPPQVSKSFSYSTTTSRHWRSVTRRRSGPSLPMTSSQTTTHIEKSARTC